MHRILDERFNDLLAAWRTHHSLRVSGATFAKRLESRRRLDEARDELFRLRRALAPREDERVNAALTVVCQVFGAPVSIPWQDVTTMGTVQTFECVCGRGVTVDPG